MFPLRDLNRTRRFSLLTAILIAINLAVFFLWQPWGNATSETVFLYQHAAIPCEVMTGQPLTADAIRTEQCSANETGVPVFPGKAIVLSILTSMFLHGSVLHVLGNMWFLWLFGDNVEDAYGRARYVLLYLCAGIAATLAFIVLNSQETTPLVGASGAIAGVLGAYLVLYPGAVVLSVGVFGLIPVPAALFLLLWFIGQFATHSTGVAWEAHVAGFVFGAAVTALVRPGHRRRGV